MDSRLAVARFSHQQDQALPHSYRLNNIQGLTTLLLVVIMVLPTILTFFLLYQAAFAREQARLEEMVQSQAQLINAITRFDVLHSAGDHPQGARAATLSQIIDAHAHQPGFGGTGEFVVGKKDDGMISFLLSPRHLSSTTIPAIAITSKLAAPMRYALSGQSGTVVGPDYRGVTVLAAYTPLPELELGLVAKTDLTEIRAPFIRAALFCLMIVVLVGILGLIFLRRLTMTQHKKNEEIIWQQANVDALTGLPNRSLLQERLSQALADAVLNREQVGLVFIGLDDFKSINDTLGHAAGDLLLQETSQRLLSCLGKGDAVGRVGGDEFAVILYDLHAASDAKVFAEKLCLSLTHPFFIEGQEIFISGSMGISFSQDDGMDMGGLLKKAAAAMSHAQESGGNNFQFYTEKFNAQLKDRLALEGDLRRALEREEFLLHYQPQVDLKSGYLTGVEALVRWQHPEQGLVSPLTFIPLAEKTGLITEIGEWVLRTACYQAQAWRDAGLAEILMSVNLSAKQLGNKSLVTTVKAILKETGLEAHCLVLELTETMVMEEPMQCAATLSQLKELGVQIALDDFGTGYSSLSYLQRLPFDKLKIDREFIKNITTDSESAALTRTIISMANSLGLRVIAEGVETEAQLGYLKQIFCHEIQGYYFSKPEPAATLTELLQTGRSFYAEGNNTENADYTLLLVDDEINVTRAIKRLLHQEGYRILIANSADEGFELLAKNKVGVILCDQRMPGMSGIEFLSGVKELYPDSVRLVLSGHADLETVSAAINHGAIYKFLTKPCDNDQLKGHIREAFSRYEVIRENQQLQLYPVNHR